MITMMKIAAKIGVSVLLASWVAGCTVPLGNDRDQLPLVADRFPVRVEPQIVSLVIPVHAEHPVAERDVARVRAFADAWKQRGYGSLGVAAEGSLAAERVTREVREILAAEGVDAAIVRAGTGAEGRSPEAPSVVLSYMTDIAVAESCDDTWTENIADAPRNLPWQSFACASQRNLAALLEDPRDLLRPRDEDPSDAMRRGVVLEKYRKGEPTAAQTNQSQEGGAVSDVAKQ
jgi:pilus assembly protein CpaD